jgi:hypothetical protein
MGNSEVNISVQNYQHYTQSAWPLAPRRRPHSMARLIDAALALAVLLVLAPSKVHALPCWTGSSSSDHQVEEHSVPSLRLSTIEFDSCCEQNFCKSACAGRPKGPAARG